MQSEEAGKAGEALVLALKDQLDIYRLAEFRGQLLELLSRGGPIVLDAGGVESCHVAGLQLLVSLQRTAAASGVTVRLENPSPMLAESLQVIGLEL